MMLFFLCLFFLSEWGNDWCMDDRVVALHCCMYNYANIVWSLPLCRLRRCNVCVAWLSVDRWSSSSPKMPFLCQKKVSMIKSRPKEPYWMLESSRSQWCQSFSLYSTNSMCDGENCKSCFLTSCLVSGLPLIGVIELVMIGSSSLILSERYFIMAI